MNKELIKKLEELKAEKMECKFETNIYNSLLDIGDILRKIFETIIDPKTEDWNARTVIYNYLTNSSLDWDDFYRDVLGDSGVFKYDEELHKNMIYDILIAGRYAEKNGISYKEARDTLFANNSENRGLLG